MAWRESLGPASFRDKPFVVDVAELAGGRKTVTHEYPLRDVPFVEDLGRRARTFSIEGYVVGPDYLQRKEALLAALEESGAGTLVHPYYGRRLVACTGYSFRETQGEGGMVRFSLQFTETEARAFTPSVAIAPAAKVGSSADRATAAVQADFVSRYATTLPTAAGGTKPLPSFTFGSASNVLTDFSGTLRSRLSPVVRGTAELASLKRATDSLALDASSLVRDPLSLVTRLGDVLTSLLEWPQTPRLGVQALLAAYGFISSASRPPATTATRLREQANYDALAALVRQQVVIQTARLAAAAADDDDAGFETYEDAIAVRDELLTQLDEQADSASDTVYPSLVQVRADVVNAVPGPQHALPQLLSHTPPITIASLVLAYRLYGELSLTEDLVARNRVRHPGFIVGGRALEVLSHA